MRAAAQLCHTRGGVIRRLPGIPEGMPPVFRTSSAGGVSRPGRAPRPRRPVAYRGVPEGAPEGPTAPAAVVGRGCEQPFRPATVVPQAATLAGSPDTETIGV